MTPLTSVLTAVLYLNIVINALHKESNLTEINIVKESSAVGHVGIWIPRNRSCAVSLSLWNLGPSWWEIGVWYGHIS